ncbi:MAG: hypothetical protein U0271_07055 [Polyangiaceae bacterium]
MFALLSGGIGVSAMGCQDSGVIERCEELVAPIEGAARAPSGELTADSAQHLLTRLYGQGAAIMLPAEVPDTCSTGSGTEEDPQIIDMECATNGAITGSVTSVSARDGDDVYVLVEYRDTCIVARDFCWNGSGAFVSLLDEESESYSELQGNDVEVRQQGETRHEVFGLAKLVNEVAGTVHFLEDQSFLLGPTPSIDLEGESAIFIAAANGDFDCTFTNLGAHGGCVGPSSFTW